MTIYILKQKSQHFIWTHVNAFYEIATWKYLVKFQNVGINSHNKATFCLFVMVPWERTDHLTIYCLTVKTANYAKKYTEYNACKIQGS